MPVLHFQFFELDASSYQAWFDVKTSLDLSVIVVFGLSFAVFMLMWFYFGGNYQWVFVDVDFILFIILSIFELI